MPNQPKKPKASLFSCRAERDLIEFWTCAVLLLYITCYRQFLGQLKEGKKTFQEKYEKLSATFTVVARNERV